MIKLLMLRIYRYFIARELVLIENQIIHARHAQAHDTLILANLDTRIAHAEACLGRARPT